MFIVEKIRKCLSARGSDFRPVVGKSLRHFRHDGTAVIESDGFTRGMFLARDQIRRRQAVGIIFIMGNDDPAGRRDITADDDGAAVCVEVSCFFDNHIIFPFFL